MKNKCSKLSEVRGNLLKARLCRRAVARGHCPACCRARVRLAGESLQPLFSKKKISLFHLVGTMLLVRPTNRLRGSRSGGSDERKECPCNSVIRNRDRKSEYVHRDNW